MAVSPVVKPDDFKYKFGAVLSKDSKRLILSPVHSNDIGSKNRRQRHLVFTALSPVRLFCMIFTETQ